MTDAPSTAIYISGFSLDNIGQGKEGQEDFKTAFEQYGEITKVKIGGKNKPFAFVTFADLESRDKAVEGGDATIGGDTCVVAAQTSVSTPKERKPRNEADAPRDPGFAIYVSGFSAETEKDEFNTIFGSYGDITRVKVGGKDKPFAFVTFADEASRDAAVEAGAATIGGEECEVAAQTSVSKPKAKKAKKAKAPAAAQAAPGFAIYVSGFSLETDKDEFNTVFGSYGDITRVKVAGKDKPFAFVTFAEEASRDAAVEAGAATIGGEECEVAAQTSVAKPKAKKARAKREIDTSGFAIYVSGFSLPDTTEDSLSETFGSFGDINRVKIGGKDKPFAFVTFETEEERDAAVAAGSASVCGAECVVAAQTSN